MMGKQLNAGRLVAKTSLNFTIKGRIEKISNGMDQSGRKILDIKRYRPRNHYI